MRRLSEIAEEAVGDCNDVAVWLGPGHVQEFVNGVPNCMVIDSRSEAVKERLIAWLSGGLIRFYYGTDLIGNEIGAAAKNVIGIAAGMLDGMGLSSLKGALMSRGTREVSRLIAAMGGNGFSAYGLCHLGDYEATVFSQYSHNRRFGELFVRGEPYTELAEGYDTVKGALCAGGQAQCGYADLPRDLRGALRRRTAQRADEPSVYPAVSNANLTAEKVNENRKKAYSVRKHC